MKWYSTSQSFSRRFAAVQRLCEKHIGPRHRPDRGIKGDWKVSIDAKIQFRRKEDLFWFLLMAANLADKDDTEWIWNT